MRRVERPGRSVNSGTLPRTAASPSGSGGCLASKMLSVRRGPGSGVPIPWRPRAGRPRAGRPRAGQPRAGQPGGREPGSPHPADGLVEHRLVPRRRLAHRHLRRVRPGNRVAATVPAPHAVCRRLRPRQGTPGRHLSRGRSRHHGARGRAGRRSPTPRRVIAYGAESPANEAVGGAGPAGCVKLGRSEGRHPLRRRGAAVPRCHGAEDRDLPGQSPVRQWRSAVGHRLVERAGPGDLRLPASGGWDTRPPRRCRWICAPESTRSRSTAARQGIRRISIGSKCLRPTRSPHRSSGSRPRRA